MARFFNTAGPCKPDIHFVLPPLRRLPEVRELVERQSYFVIHAPRQTGKTTALLTLAAELTAEGRYAAALVSAEVGAPFGGEPTTAESAILGAFRDLIEAQLSPELRPPPWPAAKPGHCVVAGLAAWAEACPRPIVLFIDEIDALRDDALLSVLRQLRAGFPQRPGSFPSSLALIGLRDVRECNIVTRSLTLRTFSREETADLYVQHTTETGQPFEQAAIDRAFDLSRGQPGLVNALAATAVGELVRDRGTPVTAAHIDQAKERLLRSKVTHLDSLASRVCEGRVKRVIEPVLAGEGVDIAVPRADLDDAFDLGLLALDATGNLTIANPIYRELILRQLATPPPARTA